jgi:hypothetical protein
MTYKCLFCTELVGVFPTIVALQTDGLKVTFDFAKPPGSPETTIIKASYTNLSSRLYTDFVFQAAVPKVRNGLRSQYYGRPSWICSFMDIEST